MADAKIDQQDQEFDEIERYELRENGRYRFQANRREFVQVLGAGIAVAVSVDVAQGQRRGGQRAPRREEKLAERFHLAESGHVTVLTSKVDVGQDSRTQLAQAVAEELRLPIERVRVIMADTQLCPDDGGTAGSRTTPSTVPRVRNAAAALHLALAKYAAQRLGVEPGMLKTDAGIYSSGDKQITLADLAKDEKLAALLAVPPPADVAVVPVDDWKVLGKPIPKVNGESVVTGAAQYPSDIIRPDMLYGKVLRPVAFNATLKSVDLAPAQAMEGVTVVRDGNFIGCAAPNSWLAAKAVSAVATTAQWELPDSPPSSETLFEHLKSRGANTPSRTTGSDNREDSSSKGILEAEYTVAYIQHAPMEPRAAVAEWQDGRLTVWTGSQQPSRVRGELSQAFRIPVDRIRVIVPDTGGGFGGKHTGETAVEAARLAKAAGRPVSLCWTREEEFTWAYFRPAGVIDVRAAINPSGMLTAWEFTNYNSGGSAIETPYRVPNPRTRTVGSDSPLRQGSYRALASTANTFARESAMDELAAMAKSDPLEFRLRHLESGRLKDVLQAAAEKFNWQSRRVNAVKNHGVGLACGTEKGSFVAACAEVEVVDGKFKLLSVCEAYECGAIQNPRNLRAQVEGGIIMGLGGALMEAVEFKDGMVTNPNFSSYRVPRMDDVPEIDVVLLDRRDLPSVGAGETPIIAVAPAIANAIDHATGQRVRSMPLKV